MPKCLFCTKPENLEYKDCELNPVADNQIRVKSEFGAIKHGTEFFIFSGKSPHANLRFDMPMRMFVESHEQSGFQYRPGNMIVGSVLETGKNVTHVKSGEKVFSYSPLSEVATFEKNWAMPLPEGMSESDAVCTDPALFAFAAVRDANVRVGDTAVVFGMGAIGLMAVQFLKLSGCADIIVFDPIAHRRELAAQLGATHVADPASVEPGAYVHDILKKGADVALEISGSYAALSSSLRCVAMCGRVVTVGYYKGNGAALQLSMEWHHNRLELISSMPDWENPSREYPLWDNARMRASIVRLFREKKLTSTGIIDPVVDFADAKAAIERIYKDPSASVKLGVRFNGAVRN